MSLIYEFVQEYTDLSKQEKAIKKRKDELAKYIKEHAQQNGVKDSNGSSYMSNDRFVLGSQARKSIKLNQDRAKEFLLSQGVYEQVVEVKESINEDKVEQLLQQGLITTDDLEAIVDVKVTYAIDVKEREVEEEMPEVQVVERSTKKVRKFKRK